MHTDSSIRRLKTTTSDLGNLMRHLRNQSLKFPTKETPLEIRRRAHKASTEGTRSTSSVAKRKAFNLSTYKFHAIGHYVQYITLFGSTYNYDTAWVCKVCIVTVFRLTCRLQNELSLRASNGGYRRSSKINFEPQVMRNIVRKQTHLQIRERLSRLDPQNLSHLQTATPRYLGLANSDIFQGDPMKRYHIGQHDTKPEYLSRLQRKYKRDPAYKVSIYLFAKANAHRQHRTLTESSKPIVLLDFAISSAATSIRLTQNLTTPSSSLLKSRMMLCILTLGATFITQRTTFDEPRT